MPVRRRAGVVWSGYLAMEAPRAGVEGAFVEYDANGHLRAMRSVSDNGLRAITGEPDCAVACYGGAGAEGNFYGLHLGIHFKLEDGLHWLEHGYPVPRPVFPTPPPIRGKLQGES